MADLTVLFVLIGMSLVPPLLFARWVRNRERHEREPMGAVMRAFAFGATIGIAIAFILNTLFDTAASTFAADVGLTSGFLTAVVAAPIVEEATKGLGLTSQRKHITEPEDGMIYGAALGLGFAATENLLYGVTAWYEGGVGAALWTVALRILSSTILHAGASALFGYSFGMVVLGRRPDIAILGGYALAALLHATYNVLASIQTLLALALAIALVWAVFGVVRRRIERLDAESAPPGA